MIKFAVSTEPHPVKGSWPLTVGYGLALWTIAVAVAQMVSFEEFVNALQGYGVADHMGTITLAVAILALEVFSAPYLLRLRLSPAARYISGMFVLALPCVWMVLSLSGLGHGVVSAGYFGGFMRFPVNEGALALDVLWIAAAGIGFTLYGGFGALVPRGRR